MVQPVVVQLAQRAVALAVGVGVAHEGVTHQVPSVEAVGAAVGVGQGVARNRILARLGCARDGNIRVVLVGVDVTLQEVHRRRPGGVDPLQRVVGVVEGVPVVVAVREVGGQAAVGAHRQVLERRREQVVALVGLAVGRAVARDALVDGHRHAVVAVPQLAAVLDGDGAA